MSSCQSSSDTYAIVLLECCNDAIVVPLFVVKDPYDDSPTGVLALQKSLRPRRRGDPKQHFAIFGTRAPVCTTPLSSLQPNRNQICLGEQRREACQLSQGLHPTSQSTSQQTE